MCLCVWVRRGFTLFGVVLRKSNKQEHQLPPMQGLLAALALASQCVKQPFWESTASCGHSLSGMYRKLFWQL